MMGVFLILILSIAANPLNQSFIDTAMETVKLMASAQIVAHTCTQKIVEQRDLTVLNLCEKFFHVFNDKLQQVLNQYSISNVSFVATYIS